VSGEQQIDVDIRPWSDGDLPLLERLMGDPAMTEHLGGPETPEKIRERHELIIIRTCGSIVGIHRSLQGRTDGLFRVRPRLSASNICTSEPLHVALIGA